VEDDRADELKVSIGDSKEDLIEARAEVKAGLESVAKDAES
jgi:hypothetical protein